MKLQKQKKKDPDGFGTSHTFTAEIVIISNVNNFPCKGDDSSQY